MTPEPVRIVLIATNAYFVLGIRFVKKFIHYYRGDHAVSFVFFSDKDPKDYLSESEASLVKWIETRHDNWVSGTNSKFDSILRACQNDDRGYVFYFDADTDINKTFVDWFVIGDLVGGEHYGNKTFLTNNKIDTNPGVMSYVPEHSPLQRIYYYGAFFGGRTVVVNQMCKMLQSWQTIDKVIKYEPPVNDETYINKYFHTCPPALVNCEDFQFVISDKGGITDTRNPKASIEKYLIQMKDLRNSLYNVQNGKITRVTGI